jgi:hypothetical protein
MPQIIDMAEVEAAMEDMRKRGAEAAKREGFDGVFARAQLAAIPPLSIWRATERNRNADPADITLAVTWSAALVIAAAVREVHPRDIDAQFALSNLCLSELGRKIGETLLGESGAHHSRIEGKEAGHA